MTTGKATPRPWRMHETKDGFFVFEQLNGRPLWGNRADNELILAAVNAYDAHRALAAAVWNAIEDFDSGNWHASTVVSQLRTALAAVEQAEKATP